MGVDLLPVRAGESLAFTWNDWVCLETLLMDCRVDLGLFSCEVDGAFVDEETAREWGNVIDGHLVRGDLVAVDIPDDCFLTGARTRIRVLAAQVRNPVPPAGVEVENKWRVASRLRADGFVLADNLGIDVVEVDPGAMVVRDLSPEEARWLIAFSTFCLESGGFYQY